MIVRNERLTAFAGAILLVLIVIELAITANLHALISFHIFIGVLLAGPLMVKMSSVGYRFFRFYTGHPAFLEKGAPNVWLRLLAPFLIVVTLLVFISGFALALVGPLHIGLLLKIHAVSVALWLPLLAVHVYAHVRRVPRLIASDWRSERHIPGRSSRLGVNVLGLILGGIAAVIVIPISAPWRHWTIHSGVPSPLSLGIIASVFAVLIAIPLLRQPNRRGK